MILVPNFLPSTSGLKYDNHHWPKIPVVNIPTPAGNIGLGNASDGLCGGMVFAVRDLFESHTPPTPSPVTPATNSPAYNYIVERQMDALDIPGGVAKWYQWMTRSRHDIQPIITMRGLSWWTIKDQMTTVRSTIDKGHPCPIGVITKDGYTDNPLDMGKNHCLLAYGYEDDGNTTTVRIYDPNYAGDDGVTIHFDTSDPEHTTDFFHNREKDPMYGFFALDWYGAKSPSPLGQDGNPVNTDADGILLSDGDGKVWVVYGRARFLVPPGGTLGQLFPNGWIYQVTPAVLNAIDTIPVTGTVLREQSGSTWIIVGRAAFLIPQGATPIRVFPDASSITLYPTQSVHPVWNGALSAIGSIPVDGALLRESSNSVLEVVQNGSLHRVATGGAADIYQLWQGALAQIPYAPSTVQIVVLDTDTGKPIPGATVTVGSHSATYGPDGIFTASAPPAWYSVRATQSGYYGTASSSVIAVEGQTVKVVPDLKLQKRIPYTFWGKVTDSTQINVVGGATVTIWEVDSGVPGRFVATANGEGKYSTPVDSGDYAGAYSVTATCQLFLPSATVRVAPASNGQRVETDLSLPRPGVVTGKVLESDNNKPVFGTVSASGAGSVTPAHTDRTTGVYNLTMPNPGSYTLTATADGFQPSAPVTVTAANDKTVAAPPFSLVKAMPGSVQVTVTDVDTQQAISGVKVTLHGTGTPPPKFTGTDGKCTISTFSGPATVVATMAHYVNSQESIAVVAGQTTPLNIQLQHVDKPPH